MTFNDITPDDALLLVLPIAHNFPLACPGVQGFMLRGARSILGASTRPSDVFPLIEQERITHIEFVPAVLIRWVNDPLIKQFDLSSVRVINTGGQKLQLEVKHRTEKLMPNCVPIRCVAISASLSTMHGPLRLMVFIALGT